MRKTVRLLSLVTAVFFLPGLVSALVMLLPGAPGPADAVAAEKTIIRVAGSTTVLPVAAKAAEEFMALHPGVRITVNPGGSGVGVKSVGRGLADIGMVSREITEKERGYFSGVDFRVLVFARDAVACVVSSEVYDNGVKSLSKEQIRAIYSGDITNWKDVGGPDREILVIDKEAHRGTRHVFMGYVFGDRLAAAHGARIISGSNNEEQTRVAMSGSAIGMLSVAWTNDDVKGLGIREGGRVIEPTIENIRNGAYPISRALTFVTNGPPRGAVKDFLDFVMSPAGTRIIRESGYVPAR